MGDVANAALLSLTCGVGYSRLALSLKSGAGMGDEALGLFASPAAGVSKSPFGEE